ncbi:3-galactosyl-N-acetylglucosaminide 4-alpha-L-fucosyltransferase FUT3-like [Haliotis asinina]|uniref:3-galactosyl-N-acetylglucosaminide 4-alpha-L-fucosyltransferase FUT3-like n=1 Tax=Haliotis asinina TaxID=109174 RepID=UPI003531CBB8
MPSRENDPGGVRTTQQKLKYFLALLIATVMFGGVMLYNNVSSLVRTGLWMAPQTNISPSMEGRATNSNVLVLGNKLAFSRISRLPYFYKPVSFHSSDKYRQPRSHSLDFTRGYRPVTSNKSKLILFHNPPGWFSGDTIRNTCQQGIQECPQSNCHCSYDPKQMDRADAVIFDGVQLKYRMPPSKQTNQVWILFGLECPFLYNNHLYQTKQWHHVFNWTMTYRLDSDVILPYNVLYQMQQPPKANFSQIALNKSKSVLWFVSNCNTQSKRQQYVKELRKYISVDIHGRCGTLKCRGPKCNSLYNQYRFYLSFENSLCVDYVTEKLFKVYGHNIVPVVRGGADYQSLIPKGTYINAADFSSPKELAMYLKYLETNVTAYAEILENKSGYRPKGRALQSAFCDICVKLNNLMSYRQQYYDIVKWLKQDTCRPPRDI